MADENLINNLTDTPSQQPQQPQPPQQPQQQPSESNTNNSEHMQELHEARQRVQEMEQQQRELDTAIKDLFTADDDDRYIASFKRVAKRAGIADDAIEQMVQQAQQQSQPQQPPQPQQPQQPSGGDGVDEVRKQLEQNDQDVDRLFNLYKHSLQRDMNQRIAEVVENSEVLKRLNEMNEGAGDRQKEMLQNQIRRQATSVFQKKVDRAGGNLGRNEPAEIDKSVDEAAKEVLGMFESVIGEVPTSVGKSQDALSVAAERARKEGTQWPSVGEYRTSEGRKKAQQAAKNAITLALAGDQPGAKV